SGFAAGTCVDMTQLGAPQGIVLDSAENIYVTNQGGSPPNAPGFSVTIYGAGSSGNVAPLETIMGSNTGLNVPQGITLDSAGNIYVANQIGNTVTVYPPFGSTFVGTLNLAPIATVNAAGPTGLTIGPFEP